jgi:hypothetical protein
MSGNLIYIFMLVFVGGLMFVLIRYGGDGLELLRAAGCELRLPPGNPQGKTMPDYAWFGVSSYCGREFCGTLIVRRYADGLGLQPIKFRWPFVRNLGTRPSDKEAFLPFSRLIRTNSSNHPLTLVASPTNILLNLGIEPDSIPIDNASCVPRTKKNERTNA